MNLSDLLNKKVTNRYTSLFRSFEYESSVLDLIRNRGSYSYDDIELKNEGYFGGFETKEQIGWVVFSMKHGDKISFYKILDWFSLKHYLDRYEDRIYDATEEEIKMASKMKHYDN